MAGHEVGLLDQVGGADGLGPEAQVRHRGRADFFESRDRSSPGPEVGVLPMIFTDDLVDPTCRRRRGRRGLHLAGGAGDPEASSTGRLRWVTSSTIPTVKCGRGGGGELVEHRLHVGGSAARWRRAVPAAHDGRGGAACGSSARWRSSARAVTTSR